MLKHTLVTLDGSPLAEGALPYVKSLTMPKGEITLLSVVDVPDYPVYNFYPAPVNVHGDQRNEMVADMTGQTKEYLEKLADAFRKEAFQVNVCVKIGEPATIIVEEAEKRGVDAIIISTHGRSGFSRWLFGSVTQKVLNVMPCPVFVIPGVKGGTKTDTPET